jgi:hypothetical protein
MWLLVMVLFELMELTHPFEGENDAQVVINVHDGKIKPIMFKVLKLMTWSNKQEEICQPMQIKSNSRLLSNGEVAEVIPPKKKIPNYLSK